MNRILLLCITFLSLALNAADATRTSAKVSSYHLKKMHIQAKHSARMNKKVAQKLAKKHTFSGAYYQSSLPTFEEERLSKNILEKLYSQYEQSNRSPVSGEYKTECKKLQLTLEGSEFHQKLQKWGKQRGLQLTNVEIDEEF